MLYFQKCDETFSQNVNVAGYSTQTVSQKQKDTGPDYVPRSGDSDDDNKDRRQELPISPKKVN